MTTESVSPTASSTVATVSATEVWFAAMVAEPAASPSMTAPLSLTPTLTVTGSARVPPARVIVNVAAVPSPACTASAAIWE